MIEFIFGIFLYNDQPSLFRHGHLTYCELWSVLQSQKNKCSTVAHSVHHHSCNAPGLSTGWGHSLPAHNPTPPFHQSPPKHTGDLMTGVALGDTYSCGPKHLRRWGCIFYSSCPTNPYIPHSCTTSSVLWKRAWEQDNGKQGRDKHYSNATAIKCKQRETVHSDRESYIRTRGFMNNTGTSVLLSLLSFLMLCWLLTSTCLEQLWNSTWLPCFTTAHEKEHEHINVCLGKLQTAVSWACVFMLLIYLTRF